MDTRSFLSSLYDHAAGQQMGPDELEEFSSWVKEVADHDPGFLLAFRLADGARGYAHYRFRPGLRDYIYSLSVPDIYLPPGDGSAQMSEALSELPCWLLSHGPVSAKRFG